MKMTPEVAAVYIVHGDEMIAELAKGYLKMYAASRDLYYSAQWVADRPVNEQQLWTNLRDACGFTPGQSPAGTELLTKLQETQKAG